MNAPRPPRSTRRSPALPRALIAGAIVLTAATSVAAAPEPDGPELRLRFDPGREEVYERRIDLASSVVFPPRRSSDGKVRTLAYTADLQLELVARPGEPLGGATPVELIIASARSALRAEGTAMKSRMQPVFEEAYELPADQAGLKVTAAVRETGQQALDGSFPRLPEAPRSIRKRALIDLDEDTFGNAGVLPGGAATVGRTWVATSSVQVPGEGWEGDYVTLTLRERYRVESVTDDGIVMITATLEGLEKAKGFPFEEDDVRDGVLMGSKFLQAMAATGEGTVEGSRTIVLDATAGRIVEASSRIKLSLRHGEHDYWLERKDALERVAGDAAIARLRAAEAEQVLHWDVTSEVMMSAPPIGQPDADPEVVSSCELRGRVRAERNAARARYDAVWATLSAKVTRVGKLPDEFRMDDAGQIEQDVELPDGFELPIAVGAARGLFNSSVEMGLHGRDARSIALTTMVGHAGETTITDASFPWEIVRRQKLLDTEGRRGRPDADDPDQRLLVNLRLPVPRAPDERTIVGGGLRGAPRTLRYEIVVPGKIELDLDPAQKERGELGGGVIEYDPDTGRVSRLEVAYGWKHEDGRAYAALTTWRLVDPEAEGADGDEEKKR